MKAITLSLPFLGVRVLYTVLSAYSPLGIPGVTSGSPSLTKFNITRGDFGIWLIMSPIMELIVIVIYVTVGLATPLQNDYFVGSGSESLEDATRLYPSAYAPNPGHVRSASSVSVAKPYTAGSAYAPRPGDAYGA